MYRLLITGDRNWTAREPIAHLMDALAAKYGTDAITVIHGAARGADTLAGEEATRVGFIVEAYPADWDKYSRAAGPIRNRQMLDTGITWCAGFHANLASSKGTRHMIQLALSRDVPTKLYNGQEWVVPEYTGCPDCLFTERLCKHHR